MAVNIGILNNPKLYNYKYDQLNRITGMDVFNGTNTGLNIWTGGLTSANGDYQEKVSYDPNGNIKTYIRHGFGTGTQSMDSLTYNYSAGTNKLTSITDAGSATNYTTDIKTQGANNYTYDAAGNLITDQTGGITAAMTWSVYGKLLTITSKSLSYQYDASGNRIGKTVSSTNTWYVRDAQGNVMSVYSGTGMALQEQDLYGSSRLGLISSPAPLAGTAQFLDNLGSGTNYIFTRGKKLFELSNHLGNVLATISDKKFGTPVSGVPSQVSYYIADVKTVQDYYPFGMQQPGRTYTSSSTYRYGFNGKDKCDEINGNAVDYDYGARIYDARAGRFLSADPIAKQYPYLTPYQFASNSPILCLDIDGREADPFTTGRAEASNREWENNIRKTDPEHAEQRIYEANKQAFLTVGSMLTAGSGTLTTWFIRGVTLHGIYKTTTGIITKNQNDVKDGVNSLMFVATNKIASVVTNKVINIVSPRLYNFGSSDLGEMGEEALAREFGTYKPSGKGSSLSTPYGARKPDGIPVGTTVKTTNVVFESKVGFQKYSGDIIKQVEKDAHLIASGQIDEITWVFWRSPNTGRIGASEALLEELQKAGIKTQVAGDIPKDIIDKTIKINGGIQR